MTDLTKIPVKQAAPLAARSAFNVFAPLQREIDRLFEDFAPTFSGFATGRDLVDVRCKMDLTETKDGLELTVELPGLEEKDVAVSVSEGVLTVSGEKRFETEKKGKNYRFAERGYGSFSRSIQLPKGVKADKIKATLAKGVLTVAIPTEPQAEPKKIQVQTA